MSDTTRLSRTGRAPSLVHTLTIATLVQIIATASVLALTALAPMVAADLGIDAYWIGYQISAIYAAGTVSSAVAGTLVARFGAARIEQVALACSAAGFLGLASGSATAILVATLSIGIGYGLNNPAASQLLSRVTPAHKRNLVFSLKQSGVPLGGIFASIAFPYLARFGGWQTPLLVGAALTLAIWGWLALSHRDPPASRDQPISFGRDLIEAQSAIWRHPKLRALSLLGFVYSAMQLSMSAFAVVSLVHDAGWSLLAAGSVAAAMQFAGACGRVGWGVVADRIGGGLFTLALIGIISGVCCILFFWLTDLPGWMQVILFIVMGAATIGWNGVLLAEIAHSAPPRQVGTFTGGVLVYIFLGVIVGPSSFALIYSVFSNYETAFLIFSGTGFCGALVALHAHRRQ